MPIDSQLLRFVRHVAAEWRNGEDDWPEIEKALVGIIDADIEESKAIALLIGLRACDQQANNPHRLEALKLKQALLNRKKGYQAIQSARREKRALSLRSFERSASLIAYGFLLDRGKRAVPKAEFRALAPALVSSLLLLRPQIKSYGNNSTRTLDNECAGYGPKKETT